MDTNFKFNQKIAQTAWYIFMFLCVINERTFTFVSSEDISNIPLNLYQAHLLDPVEVSPNMPDDIISGDSYKRGSTFYGLRGKKLSDTFEMNKDEQDKRGSFYPSRGKKPSAFTALRGKKAPEEDNIDNGISSREENQDFVGDNNNSSPHQFPNNAKGSKISWDSSNAAWKNLLQAGQYSMAPSDNFMKNLYAKHVNSESSTLDGKESKDLENSLEKRLNSEFFPMRGRKSYEENEQYSSDKRANSFIPMRGRKSEDLDDLIDDKRSQGFMPMRGRRSIFFRTGSTSSQRSKWPQYTGGKRVAFHAVRGKKSDLDLDWDPEKRAFYAMRGKGLYNDGDNLSNFIDLSKEDPQNGMEVYRYRRSVSENTSKGKSKNTQ